MTVSEYLRRYTVKIPKDVNENLLSNLLRIVQAQGVTAPWADDGTFNVRNFSTLYVCYHSNELHGGTMRSNRPERRHCRWWTELEPMLRVSTKLDPRRLP